MPTNRVQAFRRRYSPNNVGAGFARIVVDLQENFMVVQRVVDMRRNGQEVLVKWFGLDYAQCTWEEVDELQDVSGIQAALASYQGRLQRQTRKPKPRSRFQEYKEQPKFLPRALFPHQVLL